MTHVAQTATPLRLRVLLLELFERYPRAVDAVVEMLDVGEVPEEWELHRNRFINSGELVMGSYVGTNRNGNVEGGENGKEEFGRVREEKVRTCIRCGEFYLARENGAGACVWHPGQSCSSI